MSKKIVSFLLAASVFTTIASASILGSYVDDSSLDFSDEVTLYNNTFLSEQSGVGYQNEYYAEYTPNNNITPVVITGESIWGKRTITQAIDYMKSENLYPMIGINASFFSYETGVPMGHVVTNGIITSKDSTELDAISFLKDGNAFIGKLGIKTTLSFGENDENIFDIAHINKYHQPTTSVMTLFTSDFGKTTNVKSEAINVILGDIDGELSIGKSIYGTIEEIITSAESIEIPDGKIVLTINTNGNEWILKLVGLMTVGEKVTISNEAVSGEGNWEDAYNIIASEGKRLLINGEVNPDLEAGSAPRTAVGIKEDGNIIFYCLDGRQSPYSYGAKQSTLAERLKELGCVDALNLDGGGSTSIAGVYPGQNAASVINSPSEGSLRKITNFIFLQNNLEPDNVLGNIYIYPYKKHLLSGSTINLSVGATDKNNHFMELGNVEYSLNNKLGNITQDGKLTLSGTGEVTVKAKSGKISGEATFYVYDNPDKLEIINKRTNKEIKEINEVSGTSIQLFAKAYNENNKLLDADESLFVWDVSENLGYIENNTLYLDSKAGEEGILVCRAGKKVTEIPVFITENYPEAEILTEDDKITVNLYSYNSPIDAENSYVKIDGKVISENIILTHENEKHIIIEIPLYDDIFVGGYHKILVKTTTKDGYSSLKSDSIKILKPENNFSDTKNHWGEDVISYMNLQGVIRGSDGYFYPDNAMTRAEFAVMMCGFLKLNPEEFSNEELTFADNDQIPEWAKNYVKAAVKNGLISGKDNGNGVYFAPSDKITRAEAATVIGRTIKDNLKQNALKFSDQDQIPEWAKENITLLTSSGFMNGYPDNTIRPSANLTRAEAVAMLYNIY